MNNKKNFVILIFFVVVLVINNIVLVIKNYKCSNNLIIYNRFVDMNFNQRSNMGVNKNFNNENYLFLGDSITDFYDLDKYYPDMPVVNSGISGDKVYEILNNIKKRVYDYNPTKIFLLIGTNQIHKEDEDKVYDSIIELINEIHNKLPNTIIYVQSIYPVNESINKKVVNGRNNNKIKNVNKELNNYCKNYSYYMYIDMYELLKDDNDNLKKEYTNDGLHLNDEGYTVVTNVLKKYIN